VWIAAPVYNPPVSIPRFILRFLRIGCEVSAGVFSNLGASAVDRGSPGVAGMFIAAAAVLTAAKSTTEYYLSDEDQQQAEAALTPLVRRHGTLRAAIEAVAAGRERSGILSQARAAEMLSLLTQDSGQDALEAGQEELLLHIGRWMEQWCLKHGEAFDARLVVAGLLVLGGVSLRFRPEPVPGDMPPGTAPPTAPPTA